MNSNDFDVIIIGGGPAGSIAGINLANAGVNTAIIERKIFPRETLCGEFLSVEVTNHLKELNLFEKFISLNPNKITSFRLITSNEKILNANLPFEGYSLKRSVFDHFLLNEAKESGVKIFQPAEVKAVQKQKDNFILQFKNENEIKNLSGKVVIGAYGKSNILDKKLNRNFYQRRSGYTGIKFHLNKKLLSGICDSVIYIFSGHNIYCGVNTVSRDEATVCYLMKKNLHESPKEQFENLIKGNKNFASFFNEEDFDLTRQEIYGMGNIYFGKKDLSPEGIIMIGDAAGMIAPLTGDGIGMAFQSAKIAAEITADCINKKIDCQQSRNIYQVEWERQFKKRILIARGIQNIILNNYFDKIPSGLVRLLIPPSISATRN